ncbi:MAG: methyltransferase family protein [Candidatus Heimdallarchaeaceae archaeon]|jgi:protein-S-isoprenylcysteine O-methyltransferase Ste14
MSNDEENIQGYKLKAHEHRDDLAGEHRFSDIGQIILLICFLALWILDSFGFYGFLAIKSLKAVFGEERETPEVIAKGVFAFVIHPMYLSSILFYLGLIFISFSLSSFAFWIIIIIFYNFIASYEEKLLIKKFGEEYREYQDKVAKWIPGLNFRKVRKKIKTD